MKKLFLILPIFLFAFNVEFTKIYKKYIIPNKDAILIKTKADLTFPFEFIRVQDGYILYGNIQTINNWLNNNFYAPNDAKFKNLKITVVDTDTIQYKIIQNIQKKYKRCSIKNIIFLSPDEKIIITKPEFLKLKYKIILNCK